MLRFIPPAGAPLGLSQIVGALVRAVRKRRNSDEIVGQFANQLGVPFAYGTSSGRAGLYTILRALHRLRPDRKVVAVPAYVCFSVPAAVARAGLQLLPIEIDPGRLDFDFAHLESVVSERLLCILSANLFGLVNDLARTERIARETGAFVIDDAAQACGATRDGRLAGTGGDVGLFSFGRGKVLGSLRGGLIVTRSAEIAAAVKSENDTLPAAGFVSDGRLLLEMIAYSVFFDPSWYWVPNSLPFLKLGVTEFNQAFVVAKPSTLAMAVVQQLLPGMGNHRAIRRSYASRFTRDLQGHPKFVILEPPPGCMPTYIRFPVIARDEETRARAIAKLRSKGIGASPFYPSAICDIGGIDRYTGPGNPHRPQAESLARTLLTLPTGPHVTERDLEQIRGILWSI